MTGYILIAAGAEVQRAAAEHALEIRSACAQQIIGGEGPAQLRLRLTPLAWMLLLPLLDATLAGRHSI